MGMCSYLHDIMDFQYTVDMEKAEQNIEKGIIFTGDLENEIHFSFTPQATPIQGLSLTRSWSGGK